MQQQSDKEFDKLFRERFESLEYEPSAHVWAEISEKLDKKKKVSTPFWMAAASVVLVLTAGFWLLKPKETIRLYNGEEMTNHSETNVNQLPLEKELGIRESGQSETPEKGSPSYLRERNVIRSAGAGIKKREKENAAADKPDTRDESTLAKVKPVQAEIPAVSPDTSTTILAAIPEAEEIHKETASASIRDIKSVGGLVNFVVEKVDKRKQKLIEFTDTEEGSFVSGINLGFVKFRSKNNN